MSGSGFFQCLSPWGGGGGIGGHHGRGPRCPGRGGSHPDRRPPSQGGPRGHVSFEDEGGYDFADDGREFDERPYTHRRGLSDAEYEARRNAIFQPDGAPPANDPTVGGHPSGGRGKGLPEPTPGWTGLPGLGHLTPLGTPHDPQGQQGMGTPNPPDIPLHQAPELQLGRAKIAVQPPGGQVALGQVYLSPLGGVSTTAHSPTSILQSRVRSSASPR
jgi:hypothetical protein